MANYNYQPFYPGNQLIYDLSGNLVGVKNPHANGADFIPGVNGQVIIASGKTLTVNNTLTLAGTDGTTLTFPSTSATIARTDAAQTFTGNQTITGTLSATGQISATGGFSSGNTSQAFAATAATTNTSYAVFGNTAGQMVLGTEGTPASLITGSTAYDGVVRSANPISFSANGGTNLHMRLNTVGLAITGTLSTTGLVDISNGASGQIKFPATQNASADANTLDDYEEGTFTPTIVGTSTAGAGTYQAQIGAYTKIGDTVFFQVNLSWNAHTGTGNMNIGGLPFTTKAVSGYLNTATLYNENITLNASSYMQSYIDQNATTVTLAQTVVGSSGAFTAVALDASGQIVVRGQYKV